MSGIKEIREADFATEVLNEKGAVLVDFYAPWCGPCRALAPVLEKVAASYGENLKVVKVNVDDAARLAQSYKIRGVPTMMFFRDGKVFDTMVGAQPLDAIKRTIGETSCETVDSCGCGCCG